ncbi:MAG: hypothetical protein WC159_09770, partial [Sphaerochaetaceae bacterium]
MIDCLFVASSKLELEGILTNYPKVVIGVGKAQSAVRTMKAIEIYKPKRIICLGYAGAITQNLRIGDLVCASSVLQYDIDLTSFGLKRCEVPTGDSNNLLGSLPLYVFPQTEARIGICGTADRFLLRSYRKDNPFLWEELGLLFCDME